MDKPTTAREILQQAAIKADAEHAERLRKINDRASLIENLRIETHGDLTLIFIRHRKTHLESLTLTILVDTEDVERILEAGTLRVQWQSNGYYASIGTRGQVGEQGQISLHRFLMRPLPGELVDHEHGNTLDNRKRYLHCVNSQENRCNQTIARSGNRSGRLGVRMTRKRWMATFTHLGQEFNFGYFDDPDLAARAYVVGKEKVRSGEIDHTSIFAPGGKYRFAAWQSPEMKAKIKALTVFDPMPDGLTPIIKVSPELQAWGKEADSFRKTLVKRKLRRTAASQEWLDAQANKQKA